MMLKHARTGRVGRRAVALVGFLAVCSLAASCRQSESPGSTPGSSGIAEPPMNASSPSSEDSPRAGPSDAAAVGGAALATARVAALLPVLETAWGIPGSSDGQLMLPFGVDADVEGNVYVSDSTGAQKFSATGEFLLRFGRGELKTALGGIAVAEDGRVYVSGFDEQVHVFAPSGTKLASIGEPGTGPGQLSKPVDVAIGPAADLHVADASNARVEVFTLDGQHLRTIGEPGEERGQFRMPRAVEVDAEGRVYVGQGDDFLIQVFSPDGVYLQTFGDTRSNETIWRVGGIAADSEGGIYATQAMANRIHAHTPLPDLGLSWEMGSLGSGPDQFSTPLGVAHRNGKLYVADQQNNRIKVYRLGP